MVYLGSKNKIAKHILPIMLDTASKRGIVTWVEPFVGGANMIDKVPETLERIGIDVSPHTIQALIAIRDFANELPTKLSESEYRKLKGCEPDPIKSWLRFICSFGGKFDAGYARREGSDETTYAARGYKNAQKQSPKLQGVQFINGSYDEFSDFENCLIYCDPPYEGTTSYKTGSFDHAKFWEWCRVISEKNEVFVSEYKAPDDFVCVWERGLKVNFAGTRKKATHTSVEKLFTLI